MGKVLVKARIENLNDVLNARTGLIPQDQVRFIEVSDALVDTGATTLMMPTRLIQQLGLDHFRTRQVRGVGGSVPLNMYSVARITIQDRECAVDVGEIGDDLPVLIGQIPLEALDFVVDCNSRRLIGNPEHGGEHIMEAF